MNNNERLKKIDDFLKYLSRILEQNPDYSFNYESVYRLITRRGVSLDDSRYRICDNDFSKWISRFSKSKNMDVFVSEKWKYFCQFLTKDKNEYSKLYCSPNHIKLYIPVDSKHLQESANLIFDFISKNNITHASKIGSDVRCDDIVIRLINSDDAKKIMDFVKNNKYIQEGLIDSNPFVPSYCGVGYVSDGSLSYNSAMSKLVCGYVNGLKKDKRLDKASVTDFLKYVELYERYLFDSNIDDWSLGSKHPAFQNNGMFSNVDDIKDVTSLKGIFKLFKMSLADNFNCDKYFEFYDSLVSPKEYTEKTETIVDDTSINEISSKMRLLISIMSQKYGEGVAINQVVKYLDTGRETLITRDYGLRFALEVSNFRDKVSKYAHSSGKSNREIINEVIGHTRSPEEYLFDACQLTYLKYDNLYNIGQSKVNGLEFASGALYSLVKKNKYNGFTRDVNVRDNLYNNVSSDEALSIISSKLGIAKEELLGMDNNQFKKVCERFVRSVSDVEEIENNKAYA